jgi:hypothetical protein
MVDDGMGFPAYNLFRKSIGFGWRADAETLQWIDQFQKSQPETCPTCGCNVLDHTGESPVVVHDIERCARPKPPPK